MTEITKIKWLYALSTIFVVLNCIFIYNDFYYFSLLPLILLMVLFAIFRIDILLLIAVFFTPLSVNFEHLLNRHVPADVNLPTEPILFGITLVFILKFLLENRFDKQVLKHPVTITILINLAWILITSFTSTMPLVSFKFLLARLWFIIPFFFLGTQLFKNTANIKKFNWLYVIPLTIVIVYTFIHHSMFNFSEETANWVVSPFYNDHTAYGAMLVMFLPLLVTFIFIPRYSLVLRLIAGILAAAFIVAIIFSYTRAAWVSIAVALVALLFLLLKIKFRTVLLMAIGVGGIFLMYQTEIVMSLEKNRQDASDNLGEHVQSISNISSDASNLERLNRWSCAFRMFDKKPFWGWGPGTYSFQYAPFQKSDERTIISTNMGDGGNAHSEYIGPLAESGVLGTVTFVLIMLYTLALGFRLYYSLHDKELKMLTAAILLGLITYFVHGGLNNFLDTDKASVPFWAFIAMLVSMDIYHRKKNIAVD